MKVKAASVAEVGTWVSTWGHYRPIYTRDRFE